MIKITNNNNKVINKINKKKIKYPNNKKHPMYRIIICIEINKIRVTGSNKLS